MITEIRAVLKKAGKCMVAVDFGVMLYTYSLVAWLHETSNSAAAQREVKENSRQCCAIEGHHSYSLSDPESSSESQYWQWLSLN